MIARLNFVKQLPDNVIPYEDFYVKYIDNYVDLRIEAWYGGYLNSLYACFPREYPPAWHNHICGIYWDRWHFEYFNHEYYLADDYLKKGGLQK